MTVGVDVLYVCVGVGVSACTAAATSIWSDIIQWNLSLSLSGHL